MRQFLIGLSVVSAIFGPFLIVGLFYGAAVGAGAFVCVAVGLTLVFCLWGIGDEVDAWWKRRG